MSTSAVLTVLGEDRTGIVARVADTLASSQTNILDISQTILDGIFSMTMLVEIQSDEKDAFEKLQNELAKDAKALGLQITLQREDVFRFMYRI